MSLGAYGRKPSVIDVLIPTLWRAERLAAVVENIDDTTRAPHRTLFVAERHDDETVAEVRRLMSANDRVRLVWNNRSALSAPITSFPIFTGTQIKEMSCFRNFFRAPVRLRNKGSSEIRGTTAGCPDSTTFPVTPSPSLYLPRRRWLSDNP